MAAMDARETAQAYFEAWRRKDFAAERELLHDDVSFVGPYDTFDNAGDIIAAVTQLAGLVRDLELRKVFAEGDDACIIYDLVPNAQVPSVTMVELIHVRDGRIDSVRVIFDTGAFSAMFG